MHERPRLSAKRKVSALAKLTSLHNENKNQLHLARWLARHITVAGSELFAVQDRVAMHHGWVITRRCGGLARGYRDPQFDGLRSCSLCAGRGTADDRPCVPCGATGRVSLEPRLEGQSP